MNVTTLVRSLVLGASIISVGLLALGCQAGGGGGGGGGNRNDNQAPSTEQKQDLWTTDTQSESVQDFSASPLPAGFFDFGGRSCDAFAGAAAFVGIALSEQTSGATDTIVVRSGDPISPSDPIGARGTVDVQITNLSLRASEPIEVLCDGEPTQWQVQATLSDMPSPMGTLSAEKTHDNGGACQTTLPVLLKLTFTNVQDPSVQRVLDFGESDLDAVDFSAEMFWVHRIDPNDTGAEPGFIVGVAGGPEAAKLIADGKAGPRLQGGQTLIACSEHDNPGGSHLHNTCTADTDNDRVPDGTDNCRFLLNPDQTDRDEDLFGDSCDPCPDDPLCPQSGDACENRCRQVNDELIAAWTSYARLICDYWARCVCIAPACDYTTFVAPSECDGILVQQQQALPDLVCQYTRFTGWGCDRCVLPPFPPLPCPNPYECPEGQIYDAILGCVEPGDSGLCDFVECQPGLGCDPATGFCCENPADGCSLCDVTGCPAGESCDPETGLCCADPTGGCPYNPCEFVRCPAGSECNPATGGCWNPETGECFQADYEFDYCQGVSCDPGQTCDPNTGACVDPNDPCLNVTCGQDAFCDSTTGQCVSFCDLLECEPGQTCNPATLVCE